jgi:hypothetical protein
MNAFARGNVSAAIKSLSRIRKMAAEAREHGLTTYFRAIDVEAEYAIKDLENAMVLDGMTDPDGGR